MNGLTQERSWLLGFGLCVLSACAPESSEGALDTGLPPPAASPDSGTVSMMQVPYDAGTSAVSTDAAALLDSSVANSSQDAATSDAALAQASLLPFREGCTWTYRVTSSTGTAMKVTTVGPEEPIGGTGPNSQKLAHRVTTTKGAADKTVSWQAVVGTSVLRYREVAYAATTGMPELEEHWVPSKLHVHSAPERRAAGARWSETYEETKTLTGMPAVTATATDNWSVDAPKVAVTVPAGTFQATVLIKSTATGSKTYWYVEGIGKVKETGGQTEELVSYDVDP
jgi:hypothetical protein